MIAVKQTVKDICEEVYKIGFQQIVIDLVQDELEPLIECEDISRDDIGAAAYDVSILLDVYNPEFEKDIDLLTRLKLALNDWEHQHEQVNKILGLPPQN
jgi:hypothetical protein